MLFKVRLHYPINIRMKKVFATFQDIVVLKNNMTPESENPLPRMWLGRSTDYNIDDFKQEYNKLKQFDLIPIENIAPGTEYNIIIKLRVLKNSPYLKLYYEIADIEHADMTRVLADSERGLVNWWIDHHREILVPGV